MLLSLISYICHESLVEIDTAVSKINRKTNIFKIDFVISTVYLTSKRIY